MSKPGTFLLEIITPRGIKYRGKVISVYLQAFEGRIGILANHCPLVTLVQPGILEGETQDGKFYMAVGDGFVKFTSNHATLLAEYAEKPGEIDVESAKQRKNELEKEMSDKTIT
ncbi:MAG: ATP synthase F1 subunit epsilon, partial [Candidatus Eremiobacteraeota bacterium]|nr:ATP synthase F1 subunit epsilon [Candidatus Eremiobacteraeota bacterium]